jgi:hypothetical protein
MKKTKTEQTKLDVYDTINSVIENLYCCFTEKQIDDVFEKANITEPTDRIRIMRKCMGVLQTFGTEEQISIEEEYDFEKAVFVEGTWRMLN